MPDITLSHEEAVFLKHITYGCLSGVFTGTVAISLCEKLKDVPYDSTYTQSNFRIILFKDSVRQGRISKNLLVFPLSAGNLNFNNEAAKERDGKSL